LVLTRTGRFLIVAARHMGFREVTRFALPDGIHEVQHSRIGIHPMMAEYSRDVTFIASGKIGAKTPLSLDTCGGYPINCYFIAGPGVALLRLEDGVSEHVLDLNAQKTYRVVRAGGIPYVGELLDERATTGWSMYEDDPSSLTVEVGDAPAAPMDRLAKESKESYIGRIDGGLGRLRFIPAAESPEMPIDRP
jgi:hypothetical protein